MIRMGTSSKSLKCFSDVFRKMGSCRQNIYCLVIGWINPYLAIIKRSGINYLDGLEKMSFVKEGLPILGIKNMD